MNETAMNRKIELSATGQMQQTNSVYTVYDDKEYKRIINIGDLKPVVAHCVKLALDKFEIITTPTKKNPSPVNKGIRDNLRLSLESYCIYHKPYMLLNKAELESLMNELFLRDERTYDFIFTLRTIFFAHLSLTDKEYHNLLETVAKAVIIPNGELLLAPKEISKRMIDSTVRKENDTTERIAALIKFLIQNDYMIPLVIINLTMTYLEIQVL